MAKRGASGQSGPTADAENAGANSKRPAHVWRPGQSGNPAGKPRGCRNRATLLAEQLIGDEGERIVRLVVRRALSGDALCLRLCIERLAPPVRERPVELEMPPLTDATSAVSALASLAEAVSSGRITPNEALALASLVENFRKAFETQDLERRVAALETHTHGAGGVALYLPDNGRRVGALETHSRG